MRTSEFKGIKTILNKYISQSTSIAELCVVDDEITLEKIVDGNFTVYGNVFLNGATCINNYGGENGRD